MGQEQLLVPVQALLRICKQKFDPQPGDLSQEPLSGLLSSRASEGQWRYSGLAGLTVSSLRWVPEA